MAARTRTVWAAIALLLLFVYLLSSSVATPKVIEYKLPQKAPAKDESAVPEVPNVPSTPETPEAPQQPVAPAAPEAPEAPNAPTSQPIDFTKFIAPLWHHKEQDAALRVQDKSVGAKIQGAINQRIQHFTDLILLAETPPGQAQRRAVIEIETFVTTFSPFLASFLGRKEETIQVTSKENREILRPWHALRANSEKGSKGILIPALKSDVRSVLHLVASLRTVLKCTLPIQIAFQGIENLSAKAQAAIQSLGDGITFLDINKTFNLTSTPDNNLDIRSLAVLASTLEQIILLTPDVVLLSDPSNHLLNPDYVARGTYIFKSPTAVSYSAKERVELRKQGGGADRSKTTQKQLKRHAEAERDGELSVEGVVVLDKSRVEVLTAALVVAWQAFQTKGESADAATCKMSWREAFESCSIEYSSSSEIAVVGTHTTIGGKEAVCSTQGDKMAFYELERGELVWYSQSLGKKSFEMPQKWMSAVNARRTIMKGKTCFVGGTAKDFETSQKAVLEEITKMSKEVDLKFASLVKKTFSWTM